MIYDLLAPFYDKFNGDIDYSAWADFIEKIISEDSTEDSSEDSFVKNKLLGFLKLAESISK